MKTFPSKPTLILLSLLGLLILSACSEKAGGEKGQPPAPRNTPQACRDTMGDGGLAHAATLDPGRRIAPAQPHTRLRLWHLIDGTRKACILEGNVTSDG